MLFKKKPIWQFTTEAESHLLHACLSESREAVTQNLEEWKKDQNFDLIDTGSYRLLPVLQKQLTDFKVEDPNISIYKGIYRKCWMNNKRLFNEVVKICSLLQSNGIPVLILKGVALSVLYYKDNGTRPMDDADILVPFDRLEQALAIFNQMGWYSRYHVSDESVFKYRKYLYHSTDYKKNPGFYIDIHWKPVYLASSAATENEQWFNTRPIIINGVELQTVSHEFHFFHVVVHGVRWNPQPSIRWIVDAITILRSVEEEFNWEELIILAEKYHAIVPIREAISYLVAVFNAPIPAWVQEKILTIPVTALDKKEYRVFMRQNQFGIIYYLFFIYYLKLKAVSEEWESLPFLSGYMKYLCLKLEIDSAWKIIFVLPQKTIFYFLTKMGLVERKKFDF